MACAGIFLGELGACKAQRKIAGGAARSYQYDTPGIPLEGALVERKFYGPPGYGETPAKDQRDTVLILRIPHAITIQPLADAKENESASLDAAKGVHELQLFADASLSSKAHKLVGKEVFCRDTSLNEAVAPSQYTKV